MQAKFISFAPLHLRFLIFVDGNKGRIDNKPVFILED
jgi:hypothetical protein